MRAADGRGRLREVFDESGGENARWNGDHSNAEKGDECTKEPPHRRYGVDVTVPDGRQCGYGPPEPGKCVTKLSGLRRVFGVVH